MRNVLHIHHKYNGNTDFYDDLANADLAQVIDNRKGLPVALAILYMHAGRAQGWVMNALNFPGHVVCHLTYGGARIVFDPFDAGRLMQAHDLRALVKRIMGPHAELAAHYSDSTTARDTLIRLQNNVKFRLIESEDYEAALEIVHVMRRVAPNEIRLILEEGVLFAKLQQPLYAIRALEEFLSGSPNSRDRDEAVLMLQTLKSQLN